MPAEYTHHLIAEYALRTLPADVLKKIRPYLSLYFFGAQGPDFCFFYKFFPREKPNLGSYLHRQGGYTAFETLKTLSARDPQTLAYALGYVTHYAADTAFHPYVYAVAGNSSLRHTAFENALDKYYRDRYPLATEPVHASLFHKKPYPSEKEKLFSIYTEIAQSTRRPPIIKASFFRSLTRFNAYLPLSFQIFSRCKLRERPQVFTTNAETLLRISYERASNLFTAFLFCMKQNLPLPRAAFGKNYLTGK